MKRNQVFVRAQLSDGRWVSADVLDLTQDSFNAFVIGSLVWGHLVASIKEEEVEEDVITYQVRPDREWQYV